MRISTLRLVAVAAALLLAAVPVTVAAATSTAEPTLSFQSGAPTTILPTTSPTSLTASPTAAPSSPGATNSPTVVHPLCSSEGGHLKWSGGDKELCATVVGSAALGSNVELGACEPKSACYYKQPYSNSKCQGKQLDWILDDWGMKNQGTGQSSSKCMGRKKNHDSNCATKSEWKYMKVVPKWRLTTSGMLQFVPYNGKCITASGQSGDDLKVADCDTLTDSQFFTLTEDKILKSNTDKCISVDSSGSNLKLATCDSSATQQFTFPDYITPAPSQVPTHTPTVPPTRDPTPFPTLGPSRIPTPLPSFTPTTPVPTPVPSGVPSPAPTFMPANWGLISKQFFVVPDLDALGTTDKKTRILKEHRMLDDGLIPATLAPTIKPTRAPTPAPTNTPTGVPSSTPTFDPSMPASATPTFLPSAGPTVFPTMSPTATFQCPNSNLKTFPPTRAPTTLDPTAVPTEAPTAVPTSVPTEAPTAVPTSSPTEAPTAVPTASPTDEPTAVPTSPPSESPTATPSFTPTDVPTTSPPSVIPTTLAPTEVPTATPTGVPSEPPTVLPTAAPTEMPTAAPTAVPTEAPTAAPTIDPTETPTAQPTLVPTEEPSVGPSATPSYSDCRTIGGVGSAPSGSKCYFPFEYNGKKFSQCSTANWKVFDLENKKEGGCSSTKTGSVNGPIEKCQQACLASKDCIGIQHRKDQGDCDLLTGTCDFLSKYHTSGSWHIQSREFFDKSLHSDYPAWCYVKYAEDPWLNLISSKWGACASNCPGVEAPSKSTVDVTRTLSTVQRSRLAKLSTLPRHKVKHSRLAKLSTLPRHEHRYESSGSGLGEITFVVMGIGMLLFAGHSITQARARVHARNTAVSPEYYQEIAAVGVGPEDCWLADM